MSIHLPQRKHADPQSRLLDWILWAALVLALVLVLYTFADTDLLSDLSGQWFTLILFTGILYGAFIGYNRPLFRNRTFWLLTATAFIVHTALFAFIVTRIHPWRSLWSALMFFEAPLLDALKERFAAAEKDTAPRAEPHLP